MAGNANSKLKLLRLMDILNEYSDEDHPLSAPELCAMLSDYGITAERKSIYNDISTLEEYGLDVIKSSDGKKGYFIGEREFQIPEIRLLLDAVRSAKFISPDKTKELSKKIQHGLSTYQRQELYDQVYYDDSQKEQNDKIYFVIDALSRAVHEKKKVSIHYRRRVIETSEKPKNEDRLYKLTPYALIWRDDHYYLIANNEKYDNLMHLRIDRITSANILSENGRPVSEVSDYVDKFDVVDYTNRVFNMFSGESARIEIKCSNDKWEVVRDRFGFDVLVIDRDDETFTISIVAAKSEGLILWLMQFGKDMVVLSPTDFRDEMKSRINGALEAYGD